MKTLAILGVPGAAVKNGRPHIHNSFGLPIEQLALGFERVLLAVPLLPADDPQVDFALPDNVELHSLPAMGSALSGLKKGGDFARAYEGVIDQADAVFVRGVLLPGIPRLFRRCADKNIPLIHWLVGNPMALLQSHSRDGFIKDTLGKVFVWNWERQLRTAARYRRSALLCNGQEIADRYPRVRTETTVSSSLRQRDIPPRRSATLGKDSANLLCVAFVRPEKGIEYLLQAVSLLSSQRLVHLTVVGSRDRYRRYQENLDALVKDLNLSDKVTWAGHANQEQIAGHLSWADAFALPTLSEGTPRVLLEAQAASVPVVASQVGGIPSTITHGVNGLLVEPKNPVALANALDRILMDENLRSTMISGGHDFALANTVERWGQQVMDLFARL